MSIVILRFWRVLLTTFVLLPWPGLAFAQDFPQKPLRLVVPFPPGGPSDATARLTANAMASDLGQPVVVENRPGAGAIIGSQAVLSAPHDGHTLLLSSNVLVTGKWLYPKLPFDPMTDFRAVAGVLKALSLW